MDRKKFIKNCAGLTGLGLTISVLGHSCKAGAFINHSMDNGTIAVKKSDLLEYPFVLIQPKNLPVPIFLAKLENTQYTALLLQCTHRACEVRPVGNELQCPCHGSVFNYNGEVLESPAERPLRRFQVIEDDENLYIK